MNRALRRLTLVTGALLGWTASVAAADPIQTTFAVTANFLDGKHQTSDFPADQLHFVPLPLAELTFTRHADSVRIEGLPPVSFHYGSAGDGAQSTQLSIINATYRRSFSGGWFVGAGETLYNQSTNYANVPGFVYVRDSFVYPILGSERQYSRVAGSRFEAGKITPLNHGRDHLEISAAVNPKLHGVQYTSIPTLGFLSCPFNGNGIPAPCTLSTRTLTFSDPENATQIDLSARVAHRMGKNGELLYGVRYLNYGAHYDDIPGQLADRNVGIAPLIGYRLRL
jgi:hypothetical protein